MARQKGKNLKKHCARLGEMTRQNVASESAQLSTTHGKTTYREELPPSSLRVTNFTFENSA